MTNTYPDPCHDDLASAPVALSRLRLAVVVNPLAGIGGPAGLKGSDGLGAVRGASDEALPVRASERARRCLSRLLPLQNRLEIMTWGGAMGAQLLASLGFESRVLGEPQHASNPLAADTLRACEAFLAAKADLLLFAGGDGTARNICEVVGEQLPVLGIPSGVKMQSGVFALLPEAAADVIALMLNGSLVDVGLREVRDIDEAAYRQGKIISRYFGDLLVPEAGQFVQATKQGGVEVEELVLEDMAAEVIERMDPETLYLVGAGSTTQALMMQLGLAHSLLGVDAVCDGELLGLDLSGPQLESMLQTHQGPVVAILTVTGGQGSLLGRGNQQLTPAVLRRIGKDNIWVMATKTKVRALAGRPLLIDTNDVALDQALAGFYRVVTGYRDEILYPAGITANAVGAGNTVA